MSEQVEQITIRPEILAAKMDAVRNFRAPDVASQREKHPRLFELFWFLQAASLMPGGLVKFCEDFLAAMPSCIGTRSMLPAPKKQAPYSENQRDEIMLEIPFHTCRKFLWNKGWFCGNQWDAHALAPNEENRPVRNDESERKQFLSSLDFECLQKFCADTARNELPGHLARACHETESALHDPWYLRGLVDALIQFMDIHAAKTTASLAKTEVTLKIFDVMEYAWQERALVHIEGDSRFGKTQSVKTWCAAWPGKARLVTVPCSNSDADLFQAFADALGFDFPRNTSRRQIKASVEYVIRFSGLMFVADEAHWILPTRFTANTPPMRLNWLRSFVVDKNCPLVTVSTPQDYKHCTAKFVKATGHNIQQWLGRKMLNLVLPTELEADDLLAVAKMHFPDLNADFLQVIVGSAMRAEGYLMTVEALAKRVRYIARRDGHKTVTLADLKLAMSEIMPAPPAPKPAPAIEPPRPAQHPLAVKRNMGPIRPAANPTAAQLEAPARSVSPATATLETI